MEGGRLCCKKIYWNCTEKCKNKTVSDWIILSERESTLKFYIYTPVFSHHFKAKQGLKRPLPLPRKQHLQQEKKGGMLVRMYCLHVALLPLSDRLATRRVDLFKTYVDTHTTFFYLYTSYMYFHKNLRFFFTFHSLCCCFTMITVSTPLERHFWLQCRLE